ncbi:PREDICTED: bifunctional lysine-specific demethylase and histidyl-hydroxylase NO66 [Polistes dominula]|uniref:Bifunctional lysine-specific demethylase and histidyl-hydroxylase n=1 Tax=Polistes dominula TaxID=743375 RepID=A0ABM1HUP5_POLDO|nr:PREDICTED: bifunctional lysine-specific demethylase and histidyl-hydroxylase NO66 [Polistes dominula]
MFSKNEQISAFAVYSKRRKNSDTSLRLQKFLKKRSNMGNKKTKRTGNITKKKISKAISINKRKRSPTNNSKSATHDTTLTIDEINNKTPMFTIKDDENKEGRYMIFNSDNFFSSTERCASIFNTTNETNDGPIFQTVDNNNRSKKKYIKPKKQNKGDDNNDDDDDDDEPHAIGHQSRLTASNFNELFKLNPVFQSCTILEWLISPLTINKFFVNIWERKPAHIIRSRENYYKDLMSTPIFDKMLRYNCILFSKNIDITTYEDGIKIDHSPVGRALPNVVWDYYRNGCSVRMLNPQTYLPRIHKLNATLQEYFGSFVGANSYLTPPGCQGFAPHYDDVETFILQIEGKKRWKLYYTTNDKGILARYSSKDFKHSELGEPYFDKVITPGDMLYLPRGTIHEAIADTKCHSLHLTLSVYQRNSWCDLLDKLIPNALQKAVQENFIYREGLPIDFWKHFGSIHAGEKSEARDSYGAIVKCLVDKIQNYIDIDQAMDELFKNHIHDSLPPSLMKYEQKRTAILDGERMISEGVLSNCVQLKSSTSIRIIRSHCVRLVKEKDEEYRLYYSTDNSKEFHGNELQYLEIDDVFVPGIKKLLLVYPEFIKIKDLPIDDEESRYQVAKDLWDRGIIMTDEPIVSEESKK